VSRVALVHDWLTGMRGGEKVLEAIAALYPDAPIFTLVHVPGSVSPALESRRIVTSIVNRLPASATRYREYLPLFPTVIEGFDLDEFDLVISTSHCAAKSVVVPGRTPHICYCHSPMRYAWDQFDSYFGPDQVGRWRSRLLRRVLARIARWDAATADRVDRFVANSIYVAGRIRRYYNREATVVYPPVDTEFYRPDPARRPEPFFLIVSAMVPYKRLDVAIRACRRAGARLTIVGRGPEEPRLRAMADDGVEFRGWLTDEEIRDLYQRCSAVLMPGVEDFGVVPVEAMACGRPVVALARGGAVESVVDGETGFLVSDDSVDAFADAVAAIPAKALDPSAIRRHAEQFSRARFQREFVQIVGEDAASRETMAESPSKNPRRLTSAVREDAASRETMPESHGKNPRRRNSAAREHKQ
jgi:glycosyltransferase involved in cell wall biosynthesis